MGPKPPFVLAKRPAGRRRSLLQCIRMLLAIEAPYRMATPMVSSGCLSPRERADALVQ